MTSGAMTPISRRSMPARVRYGPPRAQMFSCRTRMVGAAASRMPTRPRRPSALGLRPCQSYDGEHWMRTLIKGGTIVNADATTPADVLVDGERIALIGEALEVEADR